MDRGVCQSLCLIDFKSINISFRHQSPFLSRYYFIETGMKIKKLIYNHFGKFITIFIIHRDSNKQRPPLYFIPFQMLYFLNLQSIYFLFNFCLSVSLGQGWGGVEKLLLFYINGIAMTNMNTKAKVQTHCTGVPGYSKYEIIFFEIPTHYM